MTMMLTAAARRLLTPSSSTARAVGTATAARASSTVASQYALATDSTPSYVLEAPAPQTTTLSNGVTVASLYDSGSSGSGANYLSVKISGVGSRYDKVGGEAALVANALGGSTGREHISLSGLSDLKLNISPEQLNSLKQSQITKIQNSSYESQMLDQVHSTAFQSSPKGNNLGNMLEGTAESVEKLTVGDMNSIGGMCFGGNVCVVGTGSGEHDQLVEQVDKAMGELASGDSKAVGSVKDKASFIGSDVRIRYDSHKTATVALAFQGASWTDPKSLPLALMTILLGSYTTSSGLGKDVAPAMCQEVAVHELASSISTFNLSYSDSGLFGMVATAPDNKLDDLMWYVMPNFVRLAHGTSEEELVRAKRALKTQILSSFDGDIALGEEMATQFVTVGRFISLAEIMTRVDALTMGDVKAAAMEVISDQDHALAAIGGVHELPDYAWIRRHSYMLRY